MCNLQIIDAKSCDDLYKIVGEDFWLATWCNSTAFEGYDLRWPSLKGFYIKLFHDLCHLFIPASSLKGRELHL